MKFSKVYEPRISEYAKDGKLAINSIISILEDAGSKHSASVNDNIIESGLNGVSWILVEWNVKIHSLPDSTEKLYVDTWAICSRPEVITRREFEVKNKDGKVYINACEKLVLQDFNCGKLLKITPEMMENYIPEQDLHNEFDFSKLKEPAEYDYETNIKVRATDIDFNEHVHNTYYLDYALESIEHYKKEDISGFRIAYKKPLVHGDTAIIKSVNLEDKYSVGIYKDDTLCTLVEIIK